jgi:hypothetical protein
MVKFRIVDLPVDAGTNLSQVTSLMKFAVQKSAHIKHLSCSRRKLSPLVSVPAARRGPSALQGGYPLLEFALEQAVSNHRRVVFKNGAVERVEPLAEPLFHSHQAGRHVGAQGANLGPHVSDLSA